MNVLPGTGKNLFQNPFPSIRILISGVYDLFLMINSNDHLTSFIFVTVYNYIVLTMIINKYVESNK